MEEEVKELPPESRNGQSACNEEDFAKLIAARLENKNIESQTDEASLAKPSLDPITSPTQSTGKASPPSEPASCHDMGRANSFDEGKSYKE